VIHFRRGIWHNSQHAKNNQGNDRNITQCW
jgi:hypothetical protein